jgi:PAS domain S-box-containing protein
VDAGIDYRAITETLPLGVAILRPDGACDYVNAWFADYTGCSQDEVLGTGWLAAVHPSDRRQLEERRGLGIAARAAYHCEYRLRSRKGIYRWHRASTRPFFNEAGELTHWLGTLVDIHEQFLSSLDHDGVLDVLPTIVWAASPMGEIEYMNAEWTTFTGQPSEKARGTGWFDNLHPDDRGRAIAAWRDSIETGEPCDIELRFRTRGAAYRWLVVRARAVLDEAGAIKRWHGVAIDIDDRHRLETALVESERRFRELADALPHLVWTTSADGKVDFLNRYFTEVTGIDRRTAIALGAWADIIHPDDRDASLRKLHAMLARGEAGEREHRIRTQDGSYRWMLAHTMPIRDSNSAITGWLSTATDIEAQKRSQRSLRFLARLSGLLGESLALDLTLRGLTATASEEFAARCTVGLIRPDGVVAVNAVAQDGVVIANDRAGFIPLPRAQSPITRVVESRAPLLIDTTLDIDHVERGVCAKYFFDMGMRYLLVVPLSTGKRVIGGICFARRPAEGPFDSDDFVLARSVAERAATAIDNARTHEALERSERATRIYGRFSTELAHSIETEATLKRLAELAIEEVGETSSIGLLQPDGQIAVHATAIRSNSRVNVDAVRFLQLLPKTSAMARVAASGEPLLQAYLTEDDLRAASGEDAQLDEFVRALALKSALVVPLIAHGECLGAMTFCRVTTDAPYDERDLALAQQLGERAAIAISNAQQYERISNIATVLQTASMPATLPQVPSCRFSAIYRPAKREAMIGGDWYDVFMLGDGRVGITIGDVLGSGLDAAVTMAKLRQAMQSCAVLEPDPITMLDAADATLRLHDANGLATAIAAIYDPRARRLRFASAGHPLPVLRSGKNVGTFDAVTLPPLGVRDLAVGEVCTTWLNVGDTIVLYTDGLVESTHDIIEGTARVFETLSREAPLGTPQDAHIIADAVLPDGARDDVAIVTMTVV